MTCTPQTISIGGKTISTNNFRNSQNIINNVSGDQGDPTADGYDESVAGGNNAAGLNGTSLHGIQHSGSPQTSPPGPITLPPKESNTTPPGGKAGSEDGSGSGGGSSGSPVDCTTWNGDYEMQLSPNFKVKDFSTSAYFPNQLSDLPDLAASQRCCNLQNLAVNVAELMLAKFGKFTINSGIRNLNTSANGISQHVSGQAMDIQIPGWTYAQYWENADWIKENIPYDQFIFEHSDTTGLAWYHLSFNKDGNRPVADNTKVMTMYRNNFSPGLLRFG